MMHALDIPTPRDFLPLLEPRRFKGARGGRGGAKSHFFAERIVEETFVEHHRVACLREVQSSLDESVKRLIEDKIYKLGLQSHFQITNREIVCPRTDSLIIFRGLRKETVNSIKSLEGYTRAFIEEAQTISQNSLDLLIPTIRAPGSELSFAWNPHKATDPVEKMFRDGKNDPDFLCITVNYDSNPWFPEELRRDMERDKRRDYDKFLHIWKGGYVKNSEARVFKNWKVDYFETPDDAHFVFGADWGYSVDPTVLVRAFVVGSRLFIDYEAYQVGCEIDDTPALFAGDDEQSPPRWKNRKRCPGIPGATEWVIRADSARPETISYMKRHGFPRITKAAKGPSSVKEGIKFLQNFDIVVHPRCQHVIDELTHYSWKVDKHTKEITAVLADDKNHVIDSLRYAVEQLRRARYRMTDVLGEEDEDDADQ